MYIYGAPQDSKMGGGACQFCLTIEQNSSHYSQNYTNDIQTYKLCYNYL